MRGSGALLLLVLLPGPAENASAGAKPKKLPRASVSLLISPRVGPPLLPVKVVIVVKDPRQELSCVEFILDCGDGNVSGWFDDECDSYLPQDERKLRFTSEPRSCVFKWRGEHTVAGAVRDSMHLTPIVSPPMTVIVN